MASLHDLVLLAVEFFGDETFFNPEEKITDHFRITVAVLSQLGVPAMMAPCTVWRRLFHLTIACLDVTCNLATVLHVATPYLSCSYMQIRMIALEFVSLCPAECFSQHQSQICSPIPRICSKVYGLA
jgi:hypothetical protein